MFVPVPYAYSSLRTGTWISAKVEMLEVDNSLFMNQLSDRVIVLSPDAADVSGTRVVFTSVLAFQWGGLNVTANVIDSFANSATAESIAAVGIAHNGSVDDMTNMNSSQSRRALRSFYRDDGGFFSRQRHDRQHEHIAASRRRAIVQLASKSDSNSGAVALLDMAYSFAHRVLKFLFLQAEQHRDQQVLEIRRPSIHLRRRRLLDTYAASLIHVNRLYNKVSHNVKLV